MWTVKNTQLITRGNLASEPGVGAALQLSLWSSDTRSRKWDALCIPNQGRIQLHGQASQTHAATNF